MSTRWPAPARRVPSPALGGSGNRSEGASRRTAVGFTPAPSPAKSGTGGKERHRTRSGIDLASRAQHGSGVSKDPFATGGCACGKVRYALLDAPIFTHCRHCTWPQRETGSAFAVNAMIETSLLKVAGMVPDLVLTPSASGKGQKIARCPSCRIAVWSHYATLDTKLAFIRAGTFDDPSRCPPDVHIFTATKQAWVMVPADAEAYAEFYAGADRERMFGPARMARRQALIEDAQRQSC